MTGSGFDGGQCEAASERLPLRQGRLRLGYSGPYVLDAIAVLVTWVVVMALAAPVVGSAAAVALALASAAVAALGGRGWRCLRDSGGRLSRRPASPSQLVKMVDELIWGSIDPEVSDRLRPVLLDEARRCAREVLKNASSNSEQRDIARNAFNRADQVARVLNIRPTHSPDRYDQATLRKSDREPRPGRSNDGANCPDRRGRHVRAHRREPCAWSV